MKKWKRPGTLVAAVAAVVLFLGALPALALTGSEKLTVSAAPSRDGNVCVIKFSLSDAQPNTFYGFASTPDNRYGLFVGPRGTKRDSVNVPMNEWRNRGFYPQLQSLDGGETYLFPGEYRFRDRCS